MATKIVILANGTSGVWDEKGNQPGGFKSWMEVYCEYLEANGIDPTTANIRGPGSTIFKVFRTEDPDTGKKGFNWSFFV